MLSLPNIKIYCKQSFLNHFLTYKLFIYYRQVQRRKGMSYTDLYCIPVKLMYICICANMYVCSQEGTERQFINYLHFLFKIF